MKYQRLRLRLVNPPRPHYLFFAWFGHVGNLIGTFGIGRN